MPTSSFSAFPDTYDQMNRLPASPIAGSSNTSSWSHVIGEMFGGQHRDDEVTRTELVDWNRDENSRIVAHRPSEKTTGLHSCRCVCERNKKHTKHS